MFNRRLLLICVVLWTLAACTSRQGASVLPPSTPNEPTRPLNLDDAEHIAANFLDAWTNSNFAQMYALITPNSRDAFTPDEFRGYYTAAEQKMTLLDGGRSYKLTNAIQQGSGAQIAYDMTFNTKVFGPFTDSGRTLQLVNTDEGWRVAWSQGDVFAEMKDGGALSITETGVNRGNIYDRDGQVIADQNGVVVQVTLLTKSYPTGNAEDCFNALAQIFKTRSADTMKQAYGDRTGRDFAFVIGDLPPETLDTNRAALEAVCTLQYDAKPTRRYVSGGLAPHVVGYVGRIPAESVDQWVAKGYSPDALVGLDGVERYWESTLAGKGAATLTIRAADGSTRDLAERPAVPSQSVYLTLDRKLQQAVQDMLKDAFSTAVWSATATGGAVVVMDVHTGEILAIASYPDFNVDAFNPYTALPNAQELINSWQSDPKKPTFNRATLGEYPPGSVFKIVSMAAAADSGIFNVNTRYTCTGIWNGTPLGDRTRYDWIYFDGAAHGNITLQQALTGSCDIYFWHVGWTLNNTDPNILINYAKRLGFGAPTGIQDIGEASGNLPDPDHYESINGLKWRGSDALNTVIGQGDVQVTPLQVVRMVAAIANGGTLYQPLLVKKVGIIGEPSYEAKPIPNGQLNLKPEVIKGIQQAMCAVTTDQTLGTATFVFKDFKGAAICGKTGTAQAGFENDMPHAWFAAFAGKTADAPDIAVVTIIEHSHEGSYVAAPIVRRIVETYYGLPITPWPSWYGGGLPAVHSGN